MKYKIGLACLAIVAVLTLAVIAPGEPPNKQKEQNNPAQHNEKVSPAPVVSTSEGVGAWFRENSAVITAGATIIIAAFTGVLWWATRKQAKLTREAMISGSRAFVFPTDLYADPERDRETGRYAWRFRPALRNSGQTPTKHLITHTTCSLRTRPLPEGFVFTKEYLKAISSLVPPKATVGGCPAPPLPDHPISHSDISDVQTGRKYLYLWGWIDYCDVFPGTPDHTTKFCWRITCKGNPRVQPPKEPGVTFGFTYHTDGNCADDECPQYSPKDIV